MAGQLGGWGAPASNTGAPWDVPGLGTGGGEGDAAGVEFGGIGFVFGAGEDIDLFAPVDVGESGGRQYLAPLCFEQSAGDSARPEFDIVPGILRDFLVDDDVRDLDATAGLEDAVDFDHDGGFVRS